MSLKKEKIKEYIRRIQFSNGTYYVTLPMKFMKSLGWKEQLGVLIKLKERGKIIIANATKRKK